jgi:hypothetical protein
MRPKRQEVAGAVVVPIPSLGISLRVEFSSGKEMPASDTGRYSYYRSREGWRHRSLYVGKVPPVNP